MFLILRRKKKSRGTHRRTTKSRFLVRWTSLSSINSCLEHKEKEDLTYKCLILNRRSPLICHSIDGYVLLGWHWVSQYHHVTFIHGNAIIFQLCNKGRVFRVFKEFSHFPILLIACENIVLFLATFAVAAYFSEIYKNKVIVSAANYISH